MSRADCLSLIRLRPGAQRLAPWTLILWLVAFMLLFAQPCCDAIAGAAKAQGSLEASAVHGSARPDAGRLEHERNDCQLEQASLHVLPALASLGAVPKPPKALNVAWSIPAASLKQASRLSARETGPPGDISRTYLTTLRLRI